VATALVLLCVYVLATAVYSITTSARPNASPLGIAVSVAAVVVMPVLFVRKRRLAVELDSATLRRDAASSLTCGYMAAAVLVGLVLNGVLGWWWAEDVAAIVFLFWLVRETNEALAEFREAPIES
jgi:divalent metal cation (Fe/Co/Zn/Cd) transporter